jgi:hypothetical protein
MMISEYQENDIGITEYLETIKYYSTSYNYVQL